MKIKIKKMERKKTKEEILMKIYFDSLIDCNEN